jgi:hypothetical protein
MSEKQHDTLSRRQENTGDWLFEKKEFPDWIENDDSNSILWCPGNRMYFILILILQGSDFRSGYGQDSYDVRIQIRFALHELIDI